MVVCICSAGTKRKETVSYICASDSHSRPFPRSRNLLALYVASVQDDNTGMSSTSISPHSASAPAYA